MHAFLIIAHTQFGLLEKLIKCIDDERNDIYIHIDAKVKDVDFDDVKSAAKKSKVIFTDRISLSWGSPDMVKCEYMLLERAFADGRSYEYVHLLSGVDLPLLNQNDMHNFFDFHKGTEFVHFGSKHPGKIEMERVKFYHFVPGRRNLLNRAIMKLEQILQRALCVNRVKDLDVYRGSQWFSITGDFAKYILSKKSKVLKHIAHTYIPDEFFVQTLLINSDFADKLYNKKFDNDHSACMRCMDWQRGNPYVFTLEDYDMLMSSGCMFARKFSMDKDARIVEKIVDTVLN